MRISDWSSDVCSSDLERRTRTHPGLRRVVVGVDPPAGVGGDACGIVVAGLAEDGRAHVLEDASVHGLHPERWARAVAAAAGRWQADKVVAEVNNGGAMVTSVIRSVDPVLPVTAVGASHRKVTRADHSGGLFLQRSGERGGGKE